ncbi:hypothetical protein A4A49_42741 [Nicotiana attenuata]|uniref:GRF-type domain-containing protein n=1 Tax=Nicotiana attenuata TaxID=49451 RepID=A0A1J6JMM8_NICAT|nr:hypothetical protein A4A49_42741 [Nicotiana attenuata]
MSENSASSGSSRLCLCGCGLTANHFVAKTQLNGGRRFYKCPRFDEASSCGLWEWRDEEMPPHVTMLIHNLNTSLKSVEVERNYLKKMVANLEVGVSAERLKMEKIMEEVEGINSAKLQKASRLGQLLHQSLLEQAFFWSEYFECWSAELAFECPDWIADLAAECHDWMDELAAEWSDWIADFAAECHDWMAELAAESSDWIVGLVL